MVDIKTINRLSGILWILIVLTVLIALITTIRYDITLNPGDMENTLQNVAKFPVPHIIELIFDVLSDVMIITVAGLLYILFNKNHKLKAHIGSLWLAAGGIILAAHNMGNFAVTWIAKEYVLATGAHAVALKAAAFSMLLTAKWGVTIGSFLFVLGILMYSIIITKSSRFVGWFGIVGSILAFPAMAMLWISTRLEMLSYQLYLPMMIWQIIFGIWLIRKRS